MKKVVIIGAGPAGVTAAYELLKRSDQYEVLILEESQEIGGISRTVQYNGNRMDIGGHRFFSKVDRVTDWWDEIMPMQGQPSMDDKILGRTVPLAEGGPDPDEADRVMLTRNRVSRIYYNKKFFDYPVKMNARTFRNMGFSQTMVAGFSYLKSAVAKKPEDSLENFYINCFGKKLYSMFFEGYTEKLWGRHPSQISADWGAQRTKGLSIMGILKDNLSKLVPHKQQDKSKVQTSLIEEFNYPKYGPGQLWETAAAEVEKMGGEIRKGCKVTGVQTDGNKITAVEYEMDGWKHTVEGDIIFSSMPLKDLVAGMPQVPADVAAIAAGLPYRDFVTVGLLVNKLNLKNETELKTLNNIVPDCWIYVQDTGVKLGRIQIFNNWSPYLVKDPQNTVWIGLEYFCDEGDRYWNMSEEEWVQMGIQELIKMGVISDAKEVLDSHREKVKKAYPAYFDTYAKIDKLVDYLNGFDNLYCVGRNGQHRYNNMDHSMVTSFEAVDNILSGRSDKTNIWSVNTEKAYHEEKSEEAK
ncbi:MAG: NAD(P)/FAD-dependent oxidoreductase [Lachnospiraceae bacterium]|nr:NAD(P)/FAD-dependent oxidoreductase [Lachnospiraceae bacterium]